MPKEKTTPAPIEMKALPSRSRWSRPVWLRAAVINAFIAGYVLMSHSASDQGAGSALLRQAAQVQLMHAMGTIACATFMNMGAAKASRAPLMFVLGTMCYSGPVYLHWPEGDGFDAVRAIGTFFLLAGWLIMIMSASDVDRA